MMWQNPCAWSNRRPARRRSRPSTARPATRPQNGAPMPNAATPEPVTAKASTAAKRWRSSAMAPVKAPASGPMRATPATVATRAGGSGREQADQGGAEQGEDEVAEAVGEAGKPAAGRVGMGVGAGADGGRDRGKIARVRAERGGQERGEAGHGENRPCRRLVARGAQDREARQVLRGHRDQVEGHAEAQERGRREFGRRPLQGGEG